MTDKRIAYINARLLDPESGLDAPGALLTEGAQIADRSDLAAFPGRAVSLCSVAN